METYNVKELQDKIAALLEEGKISPTDPVKLYFKHPYKDYYQDSLLYLIGGGNGELGLWEPDGEDEEEND